MFVSVYGTLRKGWGNHRVMEMANGELVGEGTTVENYNMYNLGGIPAVSLAHTSNETPVKVEVYEVGIEGLTGPLDGLEGYPNFYNRTLVPVDVVGVGIVDCWIYHIDREYDKVVKTGDWKDEL